ncbi:MAG: ribokinase [Planctomycetota bacterium]|jgi:ribokinase|nr:ribokinase [Planctomycetota bacterium]
MTNKLVTVVGSYNVGLFLKGERLPALGETQIGDKFHEGGGGKGSNQAIAAAMLGADVRFIGKIGCDKYGQDALRLYDEKGVSRASIKIDGSIHTGISVIIIDDDGNNLISVVPGANLRLTREELEAERDVIGRSRIIGFQLESDPGVVVHGIKMADSMGVQTLLDPAPVQPLPEDVYPHLAYIKPNEHEAAALTGVKVKDEDSAERAARVFLDKGVKNVIVTLGEKGCVRVNPAGTKVFPGIRVEVQDTTGAGDCFSGGFMAALSAGADPDDAIVYANCAASLSVTRLGVIESLPTREEVWEHMHALGMVVPAF